MIHVHFKYSRYLASFFIVLHVGAMLSILFSQAPIWLMTTGIIFCSFSFFCIWQRYIGLSGKEAVIQLIISDNNRWQVLQKKGQLREVILQGESLVTSFLLILNVKVVDERRQLSVVVCRDSVVEPDNFRRLCVHLKTHPVT